MFFEFHWVGQVRFIIPPSWIPVDAFRDEQSETWEKIMDGDAYYKIGPPTSLHVLRRRRWR